MMVSEKIKIIDCKREYNKLMFESIGKYELFLNIQDSKINKTSEVLEAPCFACGNMISVEEFNNPFNSAKLINCKAKKRYVIFCCEECRELYKYNEGLIFNHYK